MTQPLLINALVSFTSKNSRDVQTLPFQCTAAPDSHGAITSASLKI